MGYVVVSVSKVFNLVGFKCVFMVIVDDEMSVVVCGFFVEVEWCIG